MIGLTAYAVKGHYRKIYVVEWSARTGVKRWKKGFLVIIYIWRQIVI